MRILCNTQSSRDTRGAQLREAQPMSAVLYSLPNAAKANDSEPYARLHFML